jgi:membrane-bound ClpP family serine protease
MINIRLIWAIVTNILEEAAIALVVLLGLPRMGVHLSLWTLIILMLGWLVFSVITYRKGSHALLLKPVAGLSNMVGSRGKVVSALSPSGTVRIRGELWDALSVDEPVEEGKEVEVVRREGLKLVVRRLEKQTGNRP